MSELAKAPLNLYIFGTAELGSTNLPIKINDEEELRMYFGSNGSLIECYRKLINVTEKPNIYLCKVNGKHATKKFNILSNNGIISEAVEFKTIFSTDRFNGTNILLDDNFLEIKYQDKFLRYDYVNFPTVYDLFSAINVDAENKKSPLMVYNYSSVQYEHPSKVLVSCNERVSVVEDGYNGLNDNKNSLYNSMEYTLSLLVGEEIDVMLLADCYLDDNFTGVSNTLNKVYTTQEVLVHNLNREKEEVSIDNITFVDKKDIFNRSRARRSINQTSLKSDKLFPVTGVNGKVTNLSFYDLLLEYCAKQLNAGIVTKAVIGFKPNKERFDAQYYLKYSNKIIKRNKDIYFSDRYSSLITVTCSDVYYDFGSQIDNHYIAYAGIIASESYNKNITNVDYGDNIKPREYLSVNEIDTLKNSRFVMTRLSPLTNKVHIVNAVTTASDVFSCEYAVRSIQLLAKLVKFYLDKHIGENIDLEKERKFKDSVKDCFNELVKSSCVSEYKHDIETDINDGSSYIKCSLTFPGFLNPLSFIAPLN